MSPPISDTISSQASSWLGLGVTCVAVLSSSHVGSMIGARTADGHFTTDACVTEASACVTHVLDSYQAATLCKHVRNAVVLHVRDEFCGRAQHPTRLLSLRICLLFAMTKVPPALSTFDAFDTITFVINDCIHHRRIRHHRSSSSQSPSCLFASLHPHYHCVMIVSHHPNIQRVDCSYTHTCFIRTYN